LTKASSEDTCKLRVWQQADSNTPDVLQAPCAAAAVSPDGQLAAWASDDFLPTLTKTSNLPLRTMGPENYRHQSQITAFAFSPDGKALYSASADGYLRKWDVDTGRYLGDLDPGQHRALQSLLVPANDLVVAGEAAANASVKVWLPGQNAPLLLNGASDGIEALTYNAAADTLAAGTRTGEILVWHPVPESANRTLVPSARKTPLKAPEAVRGLALAGDGYLFAAFSHTVFWWRVSNGALSGGNSFVPSGNVSGLALVRDGNMTVLATGSGDDHTVKLWKLAGDN
jgi:WD40 repeat protein